MKKNKTMRLAVLLLVLTLVTSCFVGGTFAKYVSTASASAEARVAYWGFNSTESVEFGLFDFVDNGVLQGEEDLIAPGTKNSIKLTFAAPEVLDADRAPEVDYKVRIDTTGSIQPAYAYSGGTTPNEYPIGGTDGLITWYIIVDGTKTTYNSWTAFIKGIAALDGSSTALDGGTVYQAGEKADILYGGETIEIGWEWPFVEYKDGAIFPDAMKDNADTKAGNMTDIYGDVKLQINVTVEQMN